MNDYTVVAFKPAEKARTIFYVKGDRWEEAVLAAFDVASEQDLVLGGVFVGKHVDLIPKELVQPDPS